MTRIAIVDIDSIVIAAGALAETVYYVVDGVRFDYKSQANEHCDTSGIPRSDIDREVDVNPVSHAINILNTTVAAAVREAGCLSYEAYLSPDDKSNYRFALYPEYKANRKNTVKPTHTKALRAHAVKHLGAQICVGMEADDMMSIRAHELGFDVACIVSIDKDMKQVPCWHYNWQKKDEPVQVTVEEARHNFYTQLLVGDSIDNIKGAPGIGPAKARKALEGCTTDQEYLTAALATFVACCDGDEEEGKRSLKLNAQLVKLLVGR